MFLITQSPPSSSLPPLSGSFKKNILRSHFQCSETFWAPKHLPSCCQKEKQLLEDSRYEQTVNVRRMELHWIDSFQRMIDTATDPWGIDIERVEVTYWINSSRFVMESKNSQHVCLHPDQVKDVRLPQNLQRAMAAEAEATREARAKVII